MNRAGSLCTKKNLKEEIILFEEIKRRFERYKDDYKIEAIGRTARIGYDILKELYLNDRDSDKIAYYENFIKESLSSIIFNENIISSLKKHCLFVCLGIAPIYNRIKYKR